MKTFIKEEIFNGKDYNIYKLFNTLIFNLNARFIFLLRLFLWLKKKNKKNFISGFVSRYLISKYGCFIGSQANIGLGVKIPHPNGIIIGHSTHIGNNCIIYHQVTFGGKVVGDAQKGNYPKIGDNVTIFAGAKLIGAINVGNNSIIGANSVVNKDVPPFAVVGGVPAETLKYLSH